MEDHIAKRHHDPPEACYYRLARTRQEGEILDLILELVFRYVLRSFFVLVDAHGRLVVMEVGYKFGVSTVVNEYGASLCLLLTNATPKLV